MNLENAVMRLPFGRKGRELTSVLGNSVQNGVFSASENLRGKQRGPPKTQRLLGETSAGHRCQKPTSRNSGIRTLSRLDIGGIRQVPLHADYNVFKTRESDGGQDIVRETLFEQDGRVGSEFGVCRKRCGECGSIVVPSRMRDDVSGPSQRERHGRYNGGDVQETHGRVLQAIGAANLIFVDCRPDF